MKWVIFIVIEMILIVLIVLLNNYILKETKNPDLATMTTVVLAVVLTQVNAVLIMSTNKQ